MEETTATATNLTAARKTYRDEKEFGTRREFGLMEPERTARPSSHLGKPPIRTPSRPILIPPVRITSYLEKPSH